MFKSDTELNAVIANPNAPLDPQDWGAKPVNYKEPFYNPHEAFICSNGHIAYNRDEAAIKDILSRNVELPRVVREGLDCEQCGFPLRKLEDDLQTLQFRLSNYMKMASRLKQNEPGLLDTAKDYVRIALFLRNEYYWEIEQGQGQHSKLLSDAVMYYLRKERHRPSVVAGKIWRALLRALGVA